MNFDLSEEQVMLRDGVARFMRDEYGFEHRRKLAASRDGFSRETWTQFAELGWLALNLPEDVGGLACSFIETTIVMQELGRGLVLEPFLATAVLCAHLVDRSTSQAHREQLLPALIAGELLLALAHDEPGNHGTRVPLRSTASRCTEGYRLNGSKTVVLGAAAADRLIVSAATEDGGIALFLVSPQTAGVTVKPYALLDGTRAGDVLLEAVLVDGDAVLLAGPSAGEVLDEALDRARLAAMAQALGAMEGCLAASSDYIKQRAQFGQPLAKFQSLQHLMADMFVDAQLSRSMLYRGIALIDAAPAERRQAVAAAKILVGAAGRRVSASGVQLHGGYGTTDEYVISHYFRNLFILAKLFGDVEDHVREYQFSS